MRKSWVATCLINFLIASVMGVMLRLTKVWVQDYDYAKLIHAHSHAAMLGWVYLMIFCFFVDCFVPREKRRTYNTLFWLTQASVVGMIISFPIQGYALYSIAFSTAHIVLSYVFCYKIWKDNLTRQPEKRFLYTAMIFMVISTFGAWSLGIISTTFSKESPFYRAAIQFFLHFQFNGWFVFAIVAILIAAVSRQRIGFNQKYLDGFYWTLGLSTVVTFALPLYWNFPSPIFFTLNIIGIVLQILALGFFIGTMRGRWREIFKKTQSAKLLLLISAIFFSLKTIIQAATVFPAFADASLHIRNFTIGFIHLGMLGVISGFLFAFLSSSIYNLFWKTGLVVFYIGLLTTEILLFFGGLIQFLKRPEMPFFSEILLAASIFLPAGLAFLLIGWLTSKPIADKFGSVI